MDETSLVGLGQRFADARGVSLRRVDYLAADDGKFFTGLQAGRTCTLRMARNVVRHLSDHWPDDREWPADIPRPALALDDESSVPVPSAQGAAPHVS